MKTRRGKELKKTLIARVKNQIKTCVKDQMRVCADDERGEGFIDVLVKMLIVVVVGAVLLTIMRTAVPTLFEDMITKIRGVFEL